MWALGGASFTDLSAVLGFAQRTHFTGPGVGCTWKTTVGGACQRSDLLPRNQAGEGWVVWAVGGLRRGMGLWCIVKWPGPTQVTVPRLTWKMPQVPEPLQATPTSSGSCPAPHSSLQA